MQTTYKPLLPSAVYNNNNNFIHHNNKQPNGKVIKLLSKIKGNWKLMSVIKKTIRIQLFTTLAGLYGEIILPLMVVFA